MANHFRMKTHQQFHREYWTAPARTQNQRGRNHNSRAHQLQNQYRVSRWCEWGECFFSARLCSPLFRTALRHRWQWFRSSSDCLVRGSKPLYAVECCASWVPAIAQASWMNPEKIKFPFSQSDSASHFESMPLLPCRWRWKWQVYSVVWKLPRQ